MTPAQLIAAAKGSKGAEKDEWIPLHSEAQVRDALKARGVKVEADGLENS